MEPIDASWLPHDALIVLDSAPITYLLEDHPKYRRCFEPMFESHAAGQVRFAVTTITVAEVLTGPLGAGEEMLSRRYRSILESWQVITEGR